MCTHPNTHTHLSALEVQQMGTPKIAAAAVAPSQHTLQSVQIMHTRTFLMVRWLCSAAMSKSTYGHWDQKSMQKDHKLHKWFMNAYIKALFEQNDFHL